MGGSNSHADDDFEIGGINVTPLVDVMLVLLVIFMVTATYVTKEAIKVDLPRATQSEQNSGRTLCVLITKSGQTYLDGIAIDRPTLITKVRELARTRGASADIQALISADRESQHGRVVELLDLLRSEGIAKFAIQIEKATPP